MGTKVNHKLDVSIDRHKFKDLMKHCGYNNIEEFHHSLTSDWQLDLSIHGLEALIYDKSTWKAIYAWAISKQLGTTIEDLFLIKPK